MTGHNRLSAHGVGHPPPAAARPVDGPRAAPGGAVRKRSKRRGAADTLLLVTKLPASLSVGGVRRLLTSGSSDRLVGLKYSYCKRKQGTAVAEFETKEARQRAKLRLTRMSGVQKHQGVGISQAEIV